MSQEGAIRFLRGEFEILDFVKAFTSDPSRDLMEMVADWQPFSGANEHTVWYDLRDGSGNQIVVDRSQRELVNGRSYVWTEDGTVLLFGRWQGNVMVARTAPFIGRALPFNPKTSEILGRVIKSMIDE